MIKAITPAKTRIPTAAPTSPAMALVERARSGNRSVLGSESDASRPISVREGETHATLFEPLDS